MIDTLQILDELKQTFTPSQAEGLARLMGRLYTELANTVTKKEFKELTEIVRVLSERVDRLAEAQARTEQRVNELAEAQKRTEQRVNELAEAQKRTEEELRKLVGEHKKTREHLGSLSHTVGYVLEDRAYKGLVGLLKKDFGLEVIDGLKRDYIEVGRDKYEEINIIGRARGNGKEVWVIGDCKSQLKKGDVDHFLKSIKMIEPYVSGEKVIVAVTYQAPPLVRNYVEQKGIKLYFSYELPL